jgi:hypothetical protein
MNIILIRSIYIKKTNSDSHKSQSCEKYAFLNKPIVNDFFYEH